MNCLELLTQRAALCLPPEYAHWLTLKGLQHMPPLRRAADAPALAVNVLGLSFPNPIGMAAGFDKNAEVFAPLLDLGFGHVEVGGVTPLPQAGNPGPRVFRLREDRAIINRLGFNNKGVASLRVRLAEQRTPGIVGVNLGANKNSADKASDFVCLIRALQPYAAYFTINISSPNTPGLRDLQEKAALEDVLKRVGAAQDDTLPVRPLLVKIAPDLDEQALDAICALALTYKLGGLVVSNTTVTRPALKSRDACEVGGLSGPPLFVLSTQCLARVRLRVGPALTLIGVGGVSDGASAWAKIQAGADLVQLYTALVYQGPALLHRVKAELAQRCAADGFRSIREAVGTRATDYAAGRGLAVPDY